MQGSRGGEPVRSQAAHGVAIALSGAHLRVPAFGWLTPSRRQRQRGRVRCQEAALRQRPLLAGSVSTRPRQQAVFRCVGLACEGQLPSAAANWRSWPAAVAHGGHLPGELNFIAATLDARMGTSMCLRETPLPQRGARF
jgi:hypothetical protein